VIKIVLPLMAEENISATAVPVVDRSKTWLEAAILPFCAGDVESAEGVDVCRLVSEMKDVEDHFIALEAGV
jgi:hypothetical protein